MTARVIISADVSRETEVTIALTMRLQDWKCARHQLSQGQTSSYEAGKIMAAIRAGIDAMESHFEVPLEKELTP